jgi:hypothetical protein
MVKGPHLATRRLTIHDRVEQVRLQRPRFRAPPIQYELNPYPNDYSVSRGTTCKTFLSGDNLDKRGDLKRPECLAHAG